MTTPRQFELVLGVDDPDDEAALRRAVRKQAHAVQVGDDTPVRVLKRSIDARRGKVRFRYLVEVGDAVDGGSSSLGGALPREVRLPARVVIVGEGPAGLFCAYQLAREGIASVVVERGKRVQPRRRDLKLLNARGGVNTESNYCFGEGGAGTYSDGKLYTRSHKRGNVRDVIEVLALHGAPDRILTDARPHIGSNLLPEVISSMRERLEQAGVEFRFETRVTNIIGEGQGSDRRVVGVDLEGGSSLEATAVVLATGHSARDIYEMLARHEVPLEPKSFALGVRIEHPQALINRIQFGPFAGHPKLGAAPYRLAQEVDERGVFSFCMCPGGWIVPAMTDSEHLVVNGMSLSKRNSPYANSGLVVGIDPSDVQGIDLTGPLAGIELQKRAERTACLLGGGGNRAPATRATDFLDGKASQSLPMSSYLPGLTPSNVAEALDATGLGLASRLRTALRAFDRKMRGYLTSEAVLVGVESRTSSPVRIVRDAESMMSPGIRGLYPCGEGAGYAGGIVSAGVDGLRVAERIATERQG